MFEGWTLDGNNVVDLTTYTVTQNVTFTAKFTKLYSVIFKYEDTTLKTDTIRSGNYATAPNAASTAYKVFNGWKVNGVSEYRITADTVFVADITYKYDVKFMAEGSTHNTQLVVKNGKPTVPSNPTKANHIFVGWSLDGTSPIDVSNYIVTENVTFTAIFRIQTYTVTFKNDDNVINIQQVNHNDYATAPNISISNFIGWSIDGETVIELTNYAITEKTTFIAVLNRYFDSTSPMHGKWLGKCIGENADEGNALIETHYAGGSPLEIRAVNSEQFNLLTTSNIIPMGYPLKVDISELTYTTVKFCWTMHSNFKFALRYDSASDTLMGTLEFTSDGKTTVYNLVFTRVEKSTFEGFSGTAFNYSDFR